VEEHLATCPACRELLAERASLGKGLAAARDAVEPPPPEFAELERSLAREKGLRAWLRSRPTLVRAAVSIWSLLLVLTFFVLTRRRPDWELYPALRLNLLFAVFAFGAFLAIDLALRGPLRHGRKLHAAVAAVSLAVPMIVAFLPRAHTLHDASLQGTISHFGERVLGCFTTGLLASAPLSILVYLFNREDRLSPLTAALTAAAAGFGANLALHAHCAITDPGHLALGHALLGLVWLVVLLSVRRFSRAK
jgi:hypothetical protein